jgi:hypothetical protein
MFNKNADHPKSYLHEVMLVVSVAALTMLTLIRYPFPATTSAVEQTVLESSTPIVTKSFLDHAQQTLAKQQQTVANWLAKRYRVTNNAAHSFVEAAYLTAKEFKLDPLLILSVKTPSPKARSEHKV